MGNCQAADAATAAVIQHADGRVETAYSPLIAGDVMAANPGHYVAAIITVAHPRSSGSGGSKPVRYLKLLRPEDALLGGQFFRLVSFEGRYTRYALLGVYLNASVKLVCGF